MISVSSANPISNQINYKNVTLSSLGNLLEWFDYALFLMFSAIIGPHFFNFSSQLNNQLAALVVFATSYLCRPLGGLFFGYRADLKGRTFALRWSLCIISACTFIFGILPTVDQWGIFSTSAFILLRLIQGFSIGGESIGSMIYLAESTKQRRKTYLINFAFLTANLGFTLAMLILLLLHHYFNDQQINRFAWRLPFIFSGLFGWLVTIYRFTLQEPIQYTEWMKQRQETTPFLSWQLFFEHRKTILLLVLFLSLTATCAYMLNGLTLYFTKHSTVSFYTINSILFITTIISIIFTPIVGLLYDRLGKIKSIYITIIFSLFSIFPLFVLLNQKTYWGLFFGFLWYTFLLLAQYSAVFPYVIEFIAIGRRSTLVGFTSNVTNALFGGTAPCISVFLATHFGIYAVGGYLFSLAFIMLIASYFLIAHQTQQ